MGLARTKDRHDENAMMNDTHDSSALQNPTRAKLIDSAEKLFWYKGYKAASVDDIARAAGQSKGAFFHYFASKKDIAILALDKYVQEEIFAPLEKHFAQYGNTKEALLNWTQETYTLCRDRDYKAGCLLGMMTMEVAGQDEDIRRETSRLFLEWENRLAGYFREPERSSTLLMEPRQFARLVIASFQGLMMSIGLHKDARRAAREFQAFAEFIERLIKD